MDINQIKLQGAYNALVTATREQLYAIETTGVTARGYLSEFKLGRVRDQLDETVRYVDGVRDLLTAVELTKKERSE